MPVTGEIFLGILVAVAAASDIRFRRIPNWLVPLFSAFPAARPPRRFLLTSILGASSQSFMP
jgi:Flp pilus assembly protein protease CpaA